MPDPVTDVADLGEVRTMALADIRPYPANARRITTKAIDQCAASIRAFGWQQPIVVDPELVIIVGHVRHRAATERLGQTHGPVVVADHLSPQEVKAYRIADNRTHDYTTWDYSLLARELDGLDDDFARVLDLADWHGIVERFEQARAETGDLELTDDAGALVSSQHAMVVIFASADERDQAGPEVLKLPGVLDVRYSR